jgi:hypothetical protein
MIDHSVPRNANDALCVHSHCTALERRASAMKWEYLTTFLQADARLEEDFLLKLRDWKGGIPPYTPEALMPRLNTYGEQGWELMSVEPVGVSSKGEVLMQDGWGNRSWTSTYFCVFKRAKSE